MWSIWLWFCALNLSRGHWFCWLLVCFRLRAKLDPRVHSVLVGWSLWSSQFRSFARSMNCCSFNLRQIVSRCRATYLQIQRRIRPRLSQTSEIIVWCTMTSRRRALVPCSPDNWWSQIWVLRVIERAIWPLFWPIGLVWVAWFRQNLLPEHNFSLRFLLSVFWLVSYRFVIIAFWSKRIMDPVLCVYLSVFVKICLLYPLVRIVAHSVDWSLQRALRRLVELLDLIVDVLSSGAVRFGGDVILAAIGIVRIAIRLVFVVSFPWGTLVRKLWIIIDDDVAVFPIIRVQTIRRVKHRRPDSLLIQATLREILVRQRALSCGLIRSCKIVFWIDAAAFIQQAKVALRGFLLFILNTYWPILQLWVWVYHLLLEIVRFGVLLRAIIQIQLGALCCKFVVRMALGWFEVGSLWKVKTLDNLRRIAAIHSYAKLFFEIVWSLLKGQHFLHVFTLFLFHFQKLPLQFLFLSLSIRWMRPSRILIGYAVFPGSLQTCLDVLNILIILYIFDVFKGVSMHYLLWINTWPYLCRWCGVAVKRCRLISVWSFKCSKFMRTTFVQWLFQHKLTGANLLSLQYWFIFPNGSNGVSNSVWFFDDEDFLFVTLLVWTSFAMVLNCFLFFNLNRRRHGSHVHQNFWRW